jgi:hypothetical protein
MTLGDVERMLQARTGPPSFEYRGFTVRWTGLKPARDSDWLTGQWLAWSLHGSDGIRLYQDLGGKGGRYRPFDSFDCTSSEPFDGVQLETEVGLNRLYEAVAAAKRRVLACVDGICGPYRGTPYAGEGGEPR